MISSKHISKITMILIAIVVSLCIIAMVYSDKLSMIISSSKYNMEYETALFDSNNIMDINIIMDEESWNEMLSNAIQEVYYKCDVVINNETFHSVGIRPKGNTSLSSIVNDPDNNRYSFKLEFDHFVEGQTCFGLDKLILNNSYADATYMKEAIVYDMYKYLETDSSLYNYAKIRVNDEYWGVYFALEAIEESFMLRNYEMEKGYLYKPENMNHNGDGNEIINKNIEMQNDFRMDEQLGKMNFKKPNEFQNVNPDNQIKNPLELDNTQKIEQTINENENRFQFGEPPQDINGLPKGGPFGKTNGSDLNYTDDNLNSYSAIWEGEVNNSSKSDHKRVITALRNIAEGTNLERYMDIDNILKYMAVHNFSVNNDSLSGNMAHNYYLYESGGKLNILPWDYNLAFGGMKVGNASDVVNDPIDEPYEATHFFDALLKNEQYKKQYHQYYNKLVEKYFDGGIFEETYLRIQNQIDELVQTDPNAMYNYEEYIAGIKMLYDTVMLRVESVRGQLNGSIPSTSTMQHENPENLVDASSIDISVMGSFMAGGPDEKMRFPQRENQVDFKNRQ